jgi:hypothetical protein
VCGLAAWLCDWGKYTLQTAGGVHRLVVVSHAIETVSVTSRRLGMKKKSFSSFFGIKIRQS